MGAPTAWPPSNQNLLEDFEEGGLKKPDFINRLVSAFYPDVFDGSPESETILKEVNYFLFDMSQLESECLQTLLSEECYFTLSGLKELLQDHNLNVILYALERHKKQFSHLLCQKLKD